MSRGTREHNPGRGQGFRLRDYHPLWLAFPDHSANLSFCNSPRAPGRPPAMSLNPELATPLGLAPVRFRLLPFRSPLLRESHLISFPPGTEMVHFPGFASRQRRDDSGLPESGCPIRESPGQSLLAAHRGLSQPATPFIASPRRGIHRLPLVSCHETISWQGSLQQ